MKRLTIILLCSGLLATPLAAQVTDAAELTDEEILERFQKQKTRGLSLAPAGIPPEPTPGIEAETATASPAPQTQITPVPQSDPTPQAAPAPQTVATAPAAIPAPAFAVLPPEEQVNINISFDFDSAALREDQKPKLATLCRVMEQIDVNVFRILGHTDASGSEDYNERLSRLRAEEVKRYLVGDCGISPDRLEAIGVGESAPILPDDPTADVNRRVEFQVLG